MIRASAGSVSSERVLMVAGQKDDVFAKAGAFVALIHDEVRIVGGPDG